MDERIPVLGQMINQQKRSRQSEGTQKGYRVISSHSLNDHREVAGEVRRDKSDIRPTIGKMAGTAAMCEIYPPRRCELCSVCRNPYLKLVKAKKS